MIAALLTFRYNGNFDELKIRKIAEGAQPRFQGMPGLRSKTFSFDPERREAINFYLWDSAPAARAFLTEDLITRVTGLYGVRPIVQFLEIAALVENASIGNPVES